MLRARQTSQTLSVSSLCDCDHKRSPFQVPVSGSAWARAVLFACICVCAHVRVRACRRLFESRSAIAI
eukprot:13417372-Alexandrium_andersonii.AAC.1